MSARQKPFEAAVRHESGVAIIDLYGDIDSFAEQNLNASYAEAQSFGPSKIVLNFGGVIYINSTGIALIVGLLAEARKSHIDLVTYGLSDHYAEIFRITRLADFMTIVSDESSAMKEPL
jgi:anti-anti-sigma factor